MPLSKSATPNTTPDKAALKPNTVCRRGLKRTGLLTNLDKRAGPVMFGTLQEDEGNMMVMALPLPAKKAKVIEGG